MANARNVRLSLHVAHFVYLIVVYVRLLSDCCPTVVRLLSDCCPTVVRLLSNCCQEMSAYYQRIVTPAIANEN